MKLPKTWIIVASIGVLTFLAYLLFNTPAKVEQEPPQTGTLAFPGAEGYGSTTMGGRFGQVLFVTNLNDAGEGSLRRAIEASGPRIVVFKTGGVIPALTPLIINDPYITIAGQTAPGDGIAVTCSPIIVRTHDVVIRGMRMRIGDGVGVNGSDRDGISAWGDVDHEVYNVMIDHNSIAWAVDENLSTWDDSRLGKVHDLTFSWNISTEALNCSIHVDEGSEIPDCHSMGFLVGEWTERISIHHNLFASNADRNPRISGGTSGDFINNVIYNWDSGNTILTSYANNGEVFSSVNWDIIGNYYKETENSNEIQNAKRGIYVECETIGHIHVLGNIGWGRPEDTGDEWSAVTLGCSTSSVKSDTPTSLSNIMPQPAINAYEDVLNYAGAFPRDSIDQRAVHTTQNGLPPTDTWLVDSPLEVGGMPDYAEGTYPDDADKDGMPNEWELLHGLDPNNAEDASSPEHLSPGGYTWIEEYINSLISVR